MNINSQSLGYQIIFIMNYAKNKSMKNEQLQKKNTKKRKSADKIQRNLKVNLEPLKVGKKSW